MKNENKDLQETPPESLGRPPSTDSKSFLSDETWKFLKIVAAIVVGAGIVHTYLDGKFSTVIEEIHSNASKIGVLEERVAHVISDVADLKEDVKGIEQDIQGIKQDIHQLDKKIDVRPIANLPMWDIEPTTVSKE